MENNKDLCFIDIEASDREENEILQFSAYICDSKTFSIKETIDQKFKAIIEPKKRIYKLIRINDWNPKYEDLKIIDYEWASKINALIDNYQVITFGDFDKKILKTLFNKFELKDNTEEILDYFEVLKTKWQNKKTTPSLYKLCLLLDVKINLTKMHDALYDAWMLLEVYKRTKNLKRDDFEHFIKPLEFLPKIGETHNFFYDFTNNKLNQKHIIFIEELNINLKDKDLPFYLVANFYNLNNNQFKYNKPKKTFKIFVLNIKKEIWNFINEINNFANLLETSVVFTMGEIGINRVKDLLTLINRYLKKEVCFKFMKITKMNKHFKTNQIIERIDDVLSTIKNVNSKMLDQYIEEFYNFIDKFKEDKNEGNKHKN